MMLLVLPMVLIAAPLLFYLPGLALCRTVTPNGVDDPLERHYERVVISMLLSGWLALLLAEVGHFSLWLHLALLLLLSAGLLVWSQRRVPGKQSARRPAPRYQRWELLAFALVGMVALLLVIRPFETILGGRDAGVYANTGFAIAHTGSLVQHDALVAAIGQAAESEDASRREPAKQALSNFLGVQNSQRYIATRMRAAGFFINEGEVAAGRVVPQFLHLFPAWIALLTSLSGFSAGLFAPGLMGFAGAWSVGMLGRRLAGRWVGVLAFLLLALNSVQVWFSRYSTSETTAQFLTFAGLYFFAKFQQVDTVDTPRSRVVYAAVAGIAFGQLALTRIDFFLIVGPLLGYLLYCLTSRRWDTSQTALGLGLGAMLLHAALHISFIARAYFFDTGFDRLQDYAITTYLALPFFTQTLRTVIYGNTNNALSSGDIWFELIFLILVLAGILLLRRWPAPLRYGEALLLRWRNLLLGGMALGITLLAGYAYLVRPQIIDMDILFNTRGGWNDPLARDPRMVQEDVNEWRMSLDVARSQAGVVLIGDPEYAATAVDAAATAELRTRLQAERGPWTGPFSNQTFNWMRLQGYVGAPIALPRIFYDDGKEWWREYAEHVPPGVTPPTGLPVREKEIIPLANFVRVGWYLSPLGVGLGVLGFALWWWRGMSRAAWLFLTIGVIGTFFYVRQTYGTSDQTYIYILRRFVSMTYPAFSLGIAYALVTLAQGTENRELRTKKQASRTEQYGRWIRMSGATFLTLLMIGFFAWTGRPIYTHTEYAGAIAQIEALSNRFDEDDVLLLRGGGPVYSTARDVPEIVATPLRFAFERNALVVKSNHPGAYADMLAAQVRFWQADGRDVYLVLSASGGEAVLPGFTLEPAGNFILNIPEFEQLSNQKPRNVAALQLPFAIYRLVPGAPAQLGTLPPPLTATDFAAQIQGLYLPETASPASPTASASRYAWTNGNALLRLPWNEDALPQEIVLTVAGGERPSHLGLARVCLTLQPETAPWPAAEGNGIALGCQVLPAEAATYRMPIDLQQLPPLPTDSLVLQLESSTWLPAAEDPRLQDPRTIGIQFWGLTLSAGNAQR